MIVLDVLRMADGPHAARVRRGMLFKIGETFCAAVPFAALYGALMLVFGEAPFGMGEILGLTGLVAAGLAGQFAFGVLGARTAFISGYGMMGDFRFTMMDHLSKLPLGFFTFQRTGALTTTVAENVKMVEEMFTKVVNEIVAGFTLPLFIGILLVVIDWRMGLAAVASVPLAFAVLRLTQGRFMRLSAKRVDVHAEVSGRLLEYIDGLRVIRGYGLAGAKFASLRDSLDTQRRVSVALEIQGGLGIMAMAVVLEMGFIALLMVGAFAMLGGALSPASYLMAMVLAQKFYAPITRSLMLLVDIKYLSLALKRVQTLLNAPRLPEPVEPKVPSNNAIVFDAVSFRYDEAGDEPALSEVTFTLREGTTTALVGPSGAGKSTVAHLIARFHDVTSGAVRIGGVDLRDMASDELMRRVSMVLQDVHLFDDTVANNIRIGRSDASDEDVVAAARHAQCHAFIEALPQGYQAPIGEGGAWLSGGQKQRLSIARALLKDAPIVLLDESTASLDPECEAAFHQAFKILAAGKTVLVIAHRLHTVVNADQIVVMERGRVVQTGTHGDLIASPGLYRTLWTDMAEPTP
ncbi:ABC transporter ATP-binding protein [Rhodospirillum rubrum]|uniref:ABC transporter, transmembrane region n=1 Tax=Rhodospirillum rubrum (strain ATCC 11170 / ATH 1.1.1 / DSM 467 / LMG 4362 / NCIMB 8255 / S1) TaxID=269796 RepID=Q2RY02_RHORT|nr:ABC transporter ATP-binding protein [Rhodospirillum rubrum]ABC20993.1 ABC transporter, transmembrane region [Rhodospirillum rubrum ATCC 11170]AEO46659.1 ABC transporter transmembrane region [Rhodospirillum rubrum F11]QXG80689.1 ABC transporter ATP-binding protein/permease [Rhodospirillum rubrum]HAQ01187.1 ABC transporter ATP-binding protein [Rhodospirillum rubrum]HCF19281.1 ABC transporter ATP-binding protein [Rhodospirillum rubrum]